MAGILPTRPLQIRFDLVFQSVDGAIAAARYFRGHTSGGQLYARSSSCSLCNARRGRSLGFVAFGNGRLKVLTKKQFP